LNACTTRLSPTTILPEGVRLKKPDQVESAKGSKRPTKALLEALESRVAELSLAREAAEKQAADLKTRLQELSSRSVEMGSRIGQSDREAHQARHEAEQAEARADGLERQIVELAAQAARVVALDKEAARLRGLDEESRCQLETERRRVAQSGEERARLQAALEEARQSLDDAEKENGRLRLNASAQAEQLARAAGRADELGREARKARQEAEGEKARVAGLERRTAELSSEAALFASLEKEVVSLGGQLEEARQALVASQAEGARLRASVTALEDQARGASETVRRVESLERQLAETRESEAKARAQASEAVGLREAVERRGAEIRRLEEALKAQPAPQVAPAEGKPEEAPAPPAVEPPAAEVPGPVEPLPVPPVPKPEGSTTIRRRPLDPAEAASDPRNLFGPAGDDGRPRHVLLEMISRDTLGVVYKACERATGRVFAVRFMSGQAGEVQTAAIEQEVELLIALPHPNILQVLGSGRRQNRLYVEMDLVQAQPLDAAKIREIPRICSILRDAAEAVHYAHEEGVLHGDLNPENILVALEGDRDHALVKDFGLGHLLEGVGPQASPPVIRQAAYLPPEQMKEMKGKLSIAGDVYGLGATLYAALAGRAPFEGQDARQILTRVMMQEPPPLEKVRSDVPVALGAIVRRAMAKERSLRYETAKDLAAALTHLIEKSGEPQARGE